MKPEERDDGVDDVEDARERVRQERIHLMWQREWVTAVGARGGGAVDLDWWDGLTSLIQQATRWDTTRKSNTLFTGAFYVPTVLRYPCRGLFLRY